MPSTVSIITPSFNKHQYIGDAIQSVLDQKFTDWEYWIIENSNDDITRKKVHLLASDKRIRVIDINFTSEERQQFYVQARILNQVYPLMGSKYIFYLSDDDIIHPDCLKTMINFMALHKDISICYHTQSMQIIKPNHFEEFPGIYADKIRGGATNLPVNSHLDGGQIMHKTDCLNKISPPYFPEEIGHASTCDGHFMEKLAKHYEFHPIDFKDPLSTHRRTPISTFIRS